MTLAQDRLFGPPPSADLTFDLAGTPEINPLLAAEHYLGPLAGGYRYCFVGFRDGAVVACQIWRHPTSRQIPPDGTWLELTRWCLTPAAGENAGSRMHAWAVRQMRSRMMIPAGYAGDPRKRITTLISYSDPSHGHTGSLYRACNWRWAPTHHRLRLEMGDGGYESKYGAWADGGEPEEVKDRWIFPLRPDSRRRSVLATPIHPALRPIAERAGLDLWEEGGKLWAAPSGL